MGLFRNASFSVEMWVVTFRLAPSFRGYPCGYQISGYLPFPGKPGRTLGTRALVSGKGR